LFEHFARFAASRTFCTAGNSKPISMAMMANTTSNSMSVKPGFRKKLEERIIGQTSMETSNNKLLSKSF
jgi:hypothetical protein